MKREHLEASDEIGGKTVVSAKVPLSVKFGYTNYLQSITQGSASKTMEFDHYDEVPRNVSEEIIKKRNG